MLFVTTYKIKSFMTQDETKELMAVFAEQGSAPGTIAHYVAADASQGLVISENDNAEEAYRNLLNYNQWMDFDSKVMLTVEDAVPHILDALG